MKEKLMALLAKKKEERTSKLAMIDKSEKVEEVRSFGNDLQKIEEEIRSLEDMIKALPAEVDEKDERTAAVNGDIPGVVVSSATESRKSTNDADMEYRSAFQQFIQRGVEIPAEVRADANTLTSDIPGAIPTVLVNKIVEKMEKIGTIYQMVTKTSFAAGKAIPTSSIKPVATWVSEGLTSDKQKKSTVNIVFTGFKLRCEISMSLETEVMSLSAFEAAFIKNVSDAMIKKIEATIMSDADGSVSAKGILAETVPTGQNIEVAAAEKLSYGTIVEAEAALPEAYENGAVWLMSKKSFMSFIGMEDENGQPVARTNYGLGGKPERYLLGREVVTNEYLTSYTESPSVDTVFAMIFRLSDYDLNTNYNMGIQSKQDWDTEDRLTKAVMIADGKVIDVNSLVTVTKKA